MSALSAARNTPTMGAGGTPVLTNYPVYTNTHIYAGSLVGINSSGYLVPMSVSTTLTCVGMALETVDNNPGNSGALYCQVQQGVARWANGSSITLASVNALAYADDDQTVSTTATGKSIAGTIYKVDSEGVWVYSGLAAPISASSLTTFITLLASTTTAEGAALVGIADAGSLYTGTTVETALQEVGKKANAGAAFPMTTPVVLSTATTAQVVMRWVPKYAGTIAALDGQVTVPVTTTAKLATFFPLISAVQISGGLLAVTSTSLATLGARVTGTAVTAGNAFSAGQEITVTANTVTTFTEGELLLQMFIGPAA
jgi:hypothetical protein